MDEKEQELAIMQEGMDSTLKQLGDLKLVSEPHFPKPRD